MSREEWQQIKALFQRAMQQPAGAREEFLREQCRDEAQRAEVCRLLHANEQSSGFLATPIGPEPDHDPWIGRELGGFTIVRRIGLGGMGAVYEAHQQHPSRRAAIKVLRSGLVGAGALRRFEFESEILARLQHPGIAHVYAAGTVDLGEGPQPWFAMELIEGSTLREYAASHQQSVRQKLELLARIADAVHHAHQRGVIHRDLKPANILITPEGDPKIVDFGVARAVDLQVTVTADGSNFAGTLTAMSPEQLRGDRDAIDHRCDVYALGVLAYELLGGRLPHERGTTDIAGLVRAIEQQDPPRLGTLDPELRGDIETIVAKAIEKHPDRRYAGAQELALDIRRYLAREPIIARPPTTVYRLGKFVRRNRAVVAGIAATIFALSVGAGAALLQARAATAQADRAQYEADKASAINNFITNDFLMKFIAAANAGSLSAGVPADSFVDDAAASIGPMFAGKPLSEAAVRNEVGTIYYNLGRFEKAAGQFEQSLALWESALGPNHEDTLKAVNNLGQCFARLRSNDDAERCYRRALDGRLSLLGEANHYTLASMNNLANLYRWTGRLDDAEPLLRRAHNLLRKHVGADEKLTLIAQGNLGLVVAARGRFDEAIRLHTDAHERLKATLGADHVQTLVAARHLGATLTGAGRAREAQPLLTNTLEGLLAAVGPHHQDTIESRLALADSELALGDSATAAAHIRQALADCPAHEPALQEKAQRALAEVTPPVPRP